MAAKAEPLSISDGQTQTVQTFQKLLLNTAEVRVLLFAVLSYFAHPLLMHTGVNLWPRKPFLAEQSSQESCSPMHILSYLECLVVPFPSLRKVGEGGCGQLLD